MGEGALPLEGLGWGLAATVFLAGLRHGVDIDHLAAISDISSSQLERRRALYLCTLYALGHAAVLLGLGAVAISIGARVPAAVDSLMGRLIGGTLVFLGVYVLYSLLRYGPEARLRSRWMLVLTAIRSTLRWLRRVPQPERVQIVHDHPHGANHHAVIPEPQLASSAIATKIKVHAHEHRHVVTMPGDPFVEYGPVTAFGIGAIHGVGAETPTQILLFATAAGVAGTGAGVSLLLMFVAGLFIANTAIAIGASYGFSAGKRLPLLFVALAALTASTSLLVGFLYLIDRSDLLPALLGG